MDGQDKVVMAIVLSVAIIVLTAVVMNVWTGHKEKISKIENGLVSTVCYEQIARY